ncbi:MULTISPECIES: hypothetical protein [Pseudofrankia]|uniref:hypothetical protein n=1 Tax=Pseudofrankia TaxID=2994363 RepID=UPI000234CDA3|nr:MULTISPECIES: hypothetical protein [Pseudofrankia]OHV37697.1 hypothetical protein BCD49_03590 [Pseudofrankia sp. EUN1h]
MHSGLDWGRVLIVVPLLGFMFIAPTIVIWWDLRRDRRRFGLEALSRPIRYTADGRPGREGLPLPPATDAIDAAADDDTDTAGRVPVDVPSKGPRLRTGAVPGPTPETEPSAAGRSAAGRSAAGRSAPGR